MSASFRINGLEEYLSSLRKLPADLAAEGNELVTQHTNQAADEVIEAYPEVSGNLKGGVKRQIKTSRYGTTGRVVSSAPHAFIYETGTASRQTDLGYNRGPMPGKKIFVPTMQRHRGELEHDLADVLTRAGFEVIEVHSAGPL